MTRHKGIDLQTAYSPAKHLGLQASYRYYDQKGELGDGKMESFEIGAGYVKDWSIFLLKTYAGLGSGRIQNIHHTGESTIRYNSYFIQPAFAVQTKDHTTQFAVAAKLSPTKFSVKSETFNRDREPFVASQLDILTDQPNRLFLEPGFILRTGSNQLQVQTAVSFPTNLKGDDFLRDKTNFSIGIVFRLNASDPENRQH